MSRPFVSVIVPCRNEAAFIGPLLDSLLASTYPSDRVEVLVVDGRSDDGTRDVIERYTARHALIRLIDNPKRVTPCALNLGIEAARGEIIVRMDAHAVYQPDYITGLVAWLERTGADNVGGACVTLPANRSAEARAVAAVLAHPFGIGNAQFRLGTDVPRDVDTVPFGCFRREVFDRVGRFDEDLVRNQDDEFNFRLLRAGGRVVLVPGIVSHYYARASVRQLARMYYQYGYFKPLVAAKVGKVMTVRQLIPALFTLAVLVFGLVAPWWGPARWAGGVLLGLYVAGDLGSSLGLAPRHGLGVALAALATFPVLHLSYGLGFLAGTAALVARRGRPAADAGATPLSR